MNGLDLLLDDDRLFLERKGWDVDISRVDVGNGSFETHIIVRNFQLPEELTPRQADLLLRQLPGYPDNPMDMFWTRPDVVIAQNNQKPKAADSYETHQSIQWQRWSRHRNWNAGETDSLEAFFASVVYKGLRIL